MGNGNAFVLRNIIAILNNVPLLGDNRSAVLDKLNYWFKMKPVFEQSFYRQCFEFIEQILIYKISIINCLLDNGLDLNYEFTDLHIGSTYRTDPMYFERINFMDLLIRKSDNEVINALLAKGGKFKADLKTLIKICNPIKGENDRKRLLIILDNVNITTDDKIELITLDTFDLNDWFILMEAPYFQNLRRYYVNKYIQSYIILQDDEILYKILILSREDFIEIDDTFKKLCDMQACKNDCPGNKIFVKPFMKISLAKISWLPIPLEAKLAARNITSVSWFYTRAEMSSMFSNH